MKSIFCIVSICFLPWFFASAQGERGKNKVALEKILTISSYALEFDKINYNYINNGQEISRPAETWQELFSFYWKEQPQMPLIKFCLVYKIPNLKNKKNEHGILKIFSLTKKENCSEYFFKRNLDNEISAIVDNLKIYLAKEKSIKINSLENLSAWSFLVEFNMYNLKNIKEKSTKITSFNLIAQSRNNTEKKKYSANLIPRSYLGLSIYPATLLVDGPVQTKNRNLPRLLHDGETCHKLDDRCHDQITFSCDKCPGPWYEVVSSGCADEYDKVCGTNHCGTKNAPACPKGKKILPGRLHTEICQTESPYGLCARELKTYCSEGILICL